MVPDRSGGFGPLNPADAELQTTGTKPPVSALTEPSAFWS